jgi:YVTN family beta-propeller protein
MNRWTTGAVLLLVAALAACGNNNTKAGIVISAASATTGASSVTVPINGTEQFAASVTGVSDTTVNWQVCLPTTVSTVLPNTCTTIPGVTPPRGFTVLTGYGTINQNGFYTAPSAIPATNNFVILATSPVDSTTFATFGVVIDSGIRIQVTPVTSTINSGDSLQFTATVTGTSNTAVTWEVNGTAGGDVNNGGTISAGGLYQSIATATGSEIIKAVSGADGSTSGQATVTLVGAAPTLTSIEPEVTAQGSAQQEIYLAGTNLTSNGAVTVNGTVVPYVFVSTSLVRVPIPASLLASAGPATVQFQLALVPPSTVAETSNTVTLNVIPVRPSIIAATPQSLISSGTAATVNLTGGYFSQGTPATTVQFDNGNEGPVTVATSSNPLLVSRQLSVTLPAAALTTPGLYALTVQNPGAATAGRPSLAAINIAVTPASIPGAPGTIPSISLGGSAQPSAMALDAADGLVVVAEQGANAVVLVNLANNTVSAPIAVGSKPTGVAVDDLLPHHLAVTANSGDNTVSVIDLTTDTVTKTISLANFTPATSFPVSVGINPQTHRAIVANASTNIATIIDLINTNTTIDPACTVAPCPLTTIGGNLTPYSTGASPAIGIDPGLNWAVITPGGAGSINLVDLGYGSLSSGSGGRAPAVLGSLSISTTIQGVGVNPETHMALFTDFNTGHVTTFSLLDNSVVSVTNNGTALTLPEESAAAVNSFQNIGVAVNAEGTGTASIVDMGSGVVLQTVNGVTSQGGSPQSVVIDPATNQALVANETAGTISILSLGGSAPKPLQILEASPANSFTSTTPISLTVTGTGFTANSVVLLDGTALTGATVSSTGRQIGVSVPASMLASPRHFSVQVQNTNGAAVAVSNVASMNIIQAVTVGTSPAGVAVDSDRDLAVVTNSGSGNLSLVSIAPPSISPQSLGPVGLISTSNSLAAHINPRAVAVDARLGLAVVANYSSNDLTLLDYSQSFQPPYTLAAVVGCSTTAVCTGPAGIAFNQDTNNFLVTDSNIDTANSDVAVGTVGAASSTSNGFATISSPGAPSAVDQTPGDIAVAPSFDPFDPVNNPTPALTYAAVASAAQTSVIDFFNTATDLVVGRTNSVVQPNGVVYDSLNHEFLVSDSLNNNIVMVNPLTFVPVTVRGGFNPASIAYNSQSSTIVAVNAATGTLSFLDYLCPPTTASPSCTSPEVRATIGLVGSQISTTAPLGPKTVDVDPLLNLAVLVDSENNRVLLIPLPY